MEIDITNFARNADPYEFSASIAELGTDAGKITWNNSKEEASTNPLISTDDEFDAFRAWAKDFGAWDATEIAAWNSDECNALLIQFISGDLRELQELCPSDGDDAIDWTAAQKLSECGTIGGRIYPGDDGRIYFYMGS
jgi:hypothetical protein